MVFSCKKTVWLVGFIFLSAGMLYPQNYYGVHRLPFNTQSKELAPAFYGTGIVYCSDKKNDVIMSYTDLENNPLTNLYLAEQKKPGKFDNPRLFSRELTTLLFEGPATFSRDGKTIYFTRSISTSLGLRNRQRADTAFGIFSAILVNGQWTTITPFRFNKPEYNTGYPWLSDDGSTLYFSCDKPGGYGGFDIYVSKFENGVWGQPENLGESVNTPRNEVFPFLHQSGRLYFASRGHKPAEDLDIFHTAFVDGAWLRPVPLGEPFNTGDDDYGLILNAAMDTGYFVTNRAGSPDIFMAISTIPTFASCSKQEENDYCFVFYEPNNNEMDTTAFAYEWDLGDGTLIRALEAEHCFANPGTYLVQLNVIDKLTGEAFFSQASHTFVVEQIRQPYIAVPDTVIAGNEFTLSGSETHLPDFAIEGYYWDFGDGQRATGTEIKHSFLFPGTYQLQLGVTNRVTDTGELPMKECVTRRIVVVNPVK
jgi:hypothetical protein